MSLPLANRRIVLGVCGGIAAYKSVELTRLLTAAGAYVSPIMTPGAQKFLGAATLSALASEPVQTSLWDEASPIPHTRLGQSADLIIVAPATAKIISKLVHGLSDDLLSATLLATRAPVLLAPAMHTEMWEHPSVVRNIAQLDEWGFGRVGPEVGRLAGGDSGVGRMAEPSQIAASAIALLTGSSALAGSSAPEPLAPPGVSATETRAASHVTAGQTLNGRSGSLAGLRVLVTAGGTREPIDPVRFIGNRSSGKMGYEVAVEAARRGASVTLVSTVERPLPSDVASILVEPVETADQMHKAVTARFPHVDVAVMAAAVADFRVANVEAQKIKKAGGAPSIVLEPTADILAELGRTKSSQVVVGFAAETNSLSENARAKLVRKNADLIVGNDVSAPGVGFHHDTNQVTIVTAEGDFGLPLMSKQRTAAAIWDRIEILLERRSKLPQDGAPT